MALLGTGTQTVTSNASTTPVYFKGGDLYAFANGTWGAGTLQVYFSFDNGTTYTSLGSLNTLAADGVICMSLPEGWAKFTMSGATSPSVVTGFATRSPV